MAGCEESYGFLPCSTSLGGSIATIVIYGYCLLQGANYLSDGSEMLLEILDPGLIGGLLLPILGALPDSLIIIVSGLGGTLAEAQEQVAVGVGTLAGSTIMLLTIAWGGSVWAGRCDIGPSGRATDKQLTQGASLTKTGITTDKFTPLNAVIMSATVLLYLVIQVPASFFPRLQPIASLLGGIICLVSLAGYCAYQVVFPELQKRQMVRARKRRLRTSVLKSLASSASPFGSLLLPSGDINDEVVMKLFEHFDRDKDNSIDEGELRALLMGLSLGGLPKTAGQNADIDSEVGMLMTEFDSNQDGSVSREEFKSSLERLIIERMAKVREHHTRTMSGRLGSSQADWASHDLAIDLPHDSEPLLDGPQETDDEEEGAAAEEGSDDGEGENKPLTRGQIIQKAVLYLAIGAAACAFFSDPMVDAVTHFSKASGIPPFFVAFCVTPFASNASELVSSLKFASGKRRKNISLTFSQVYGAVTMNNTMCLGLFLLVVHSRGLNWDFTSEVIVTVGTTLIMGVVGYSRRTFETWWAIPNLALYPLAIAVVYVLDTYFGLH
jgi:Ca2+/Na+ antiporter